MLPVHLRICNNVVYSITFKADGTYVQDVMEMYRKELIRVTETGLNVRAVLAQA